MIELLAVVVVLAIIIALVVPALSGAGATRQAAAASRLVRDLQLARQQSVAGGVSTWVVFDAENQQYAIFIEDPKQPGRSGRVPMIDPSTGRAFVVATNRGAWRGASIKAVDIAGGPECGFDSRGRPFASDGSILESDGTISLSGGHTVRIAARTGRVQRAQ